MLFLNVHFFLFECPLNFLPKWQGIMLLPPLPALQDFLLMLAGSWSFSLCGTNNQPALQQQHHIMNLSSKFSTNCRNVYVFMSTSLLLGRLIFCNGALHGLMFFVSSQWRHWQNIILIAMEFIAFNTLINLCSNGSCVVARVEVSPQQNCSHQFSHHMTIISLVKDWIFHF